MATNAPSNRTRVKRLPARGIYDRSEIDAILDEGFVCHVGFVVDGQPFVIPTGYARDGDRVLIHGSAASRMLRTLENGVDVCVTVTLTDALVLARSAFHHSVNYRSVVILGKAAPINDREDKIDALRILTNHFIPSRWDDCRPPNEVELKATTAMEIPLTEASAKVRTGPPGDEDEDYALPYWAGLLPIPPTTQTPIPDPRLTPGIDIPDYVKGYRRGK